MRCNDLRIYLVHGDSKGRRLQVRSCMVGGIRVDTGPGVGTAGAAGRTSAVDVGAGPMVLGPYGDHLLGIGLGIPV
jgi:hypothetical protein